MNFSITQYEAAPQSLGKFTAVYGLDLKLKCKHKALAPSCDAENIKFFLAITKGFISLSVWLLSMEYRPSSQYRINPSQCLSV